MNNDRQLLDEIVFLAGLASDLSAINPLLDTVRLVTAKQSTDAPLNLAPDDRHQLLDVRAQLEDHLVNRDSLRKFTKESLQAAVEEQFNKQAGHISPLSQVRQQFKQILMVIGGVFVLAAVMSLALSVPYWWLLAASCTVTAMFISACWLFLSQYATFTQALRKAYAWICVGVVLLGISASAWMLFTSIKKVYVVPALHYGLIYYLFDLAFVAAYIGVRFFAQAQSVRTPLANLWIVLPASVLVGMAITWAPHIITPDDRYLRTTMPGVVLISFYGFVIALLADRVRRTLTAPYARAMGWFGAGYALSASVGIVSTLIILYTGAGFGPKLIILGIFYATGGMLVFISGYLFRLSSAGQTNALSRQR